MLIDGLDFLLTFLFELTIFVLFSIVVYRLFKQYALPFFYEQIEQIKKKEIDLKEKNDLLDLSKKDLEKVIKQQEEELFVLQKKVQFWKTLLINKNEEEKMREDLLLQSIRNKRKTQEANLIVSKTEKIVIPSSIKLAYKEIEELYSGKKGELLLRELITKIGPK